MEETQNSTVEETNQSQPTTSNDFSEMDKVGITPDELEQQPIISDDFAALVKNMEKGDELEEETSTANGPEWCNIKISDCETSSVREETSKGKPHRM